MLSFSNEVDPFFFFRCAHLFFQHEWATVDFDFDRNTKIKHWSLISEEQNQQIYKPKEKIYKLKEKIHKPKEQIYKFKEQKQQ